MAEVSSGAPHKVVGRYALYGEIAAGGMASVHIGRLLGPVGFARTVAIKRLHQQFAKDPEFVSMFLDEARLAARVQHPNVVATIDVVATEGELFLIMDYVRGESLSRLVRSSGKRGDFVPPRIVAGIMCGFLHGLHSAHEAKNEHGERLNLVHRDVSPQNVLVGSDGVARVLDFGVAKAAGRVQVTREGQIKGKLAYMPPEQLHGHQVTRTVDIYAAAVVCWEALTGERLFKGGTEAETLTRILKGNVAPPSSIVPNLPVTFDEVLLKALSREPTERYATAREMALALEKCAGIASATEIGEWVEELVGTILADRESRIAQIEQSSASLRLSDSGRPEQSISDDSMSESSVDPQGRSLPTLPDVGELRMDADADATRVTAGAPAFDDVSEERSKQTGSKLSSVLAVPIDRKMPFLLIGIAVFAGTLLLLLGFSVVLRSGATEKPAASGSARPAAQATKSATPVTSLSALSTAATPASTLAVGPISSSPVASVAPAPSLPPSAVAKPPVVTTPRQDPKPPAPKKSCDPPYTIDSNGHRHYKVECM